MTLRTSLPASEGLYQASKYLKFHVLCSKEQIEELFSRFSEFWIYPLTGIVDGEEISHERFAEEVGRWQRLIQNGQVPDPMDLRKFLACAWTKDPSYLWKQEIPGKGYLVKMSAPVVEVQAHYFTRSCEDGVFRPMSLGKDAIFWGLQISFPQWYQDPKTHEFLQPEGVNLEMFREIRQWIRDCTTPTPFIVGGRKINAPIRIGKECLSWCSTHPQLKEISLYGC